MMPAGSAPACAGQAKLGRPGNFPIGTGNDLNNDHEQRRRVHARQRRMDLHYAYLVGLPGEGGWPDWNADGTFVNMLDGLRPTANGTTPMFTVYGMAAHGRGRHADSSRRSRRT